jgi:uncharacterized membrane protein YraQ (UPF0718 family)
MKKIIKKYLFFIIGLVVMLVVLLIDKEIGYKAVDTTLYSLKEMALIIPPIFVLLGLLDVWVPRDTMVKYMGEDSGLKGIILSFVIGSAAAGPLYAAFPVAAVFMRKGVKFTNVLIFIGAWSTTKIPMFLFEMSSLGIKFALTRLLIDIPAIIIIANVLTRVTPKEEVKVLYDKAELL